MDIRYEVIEAFKSVGIIFDERNKQDNLSDLIEESIVYVSLIVEIEERLGIEIPAEYLIIDSFSNVDSFIDLIQGLYEAGN